MIDQCRSHKIVGSNSLEQQFKLTVDRISARVDLSPKARIELISMLEQLCEFELGRFLMVNKGLDGFWTDVLVKYPENKKTYKFQNDLERFIFEKAPSIKATQERYQIFKAAIQARLRDNITLASIPGGLMSDLLTLDYRLVNGFRLTGIDLDRRSLELARQQACQVQLGEHVDLRHEDVFSLKPQAEFDLISSNGLNIYLKEVGERKKLYLTLFKLLKPAGTLITSFLTPPPALAPGFWNLTAIEPRSAERQKLLFTDLLATAWQCFVSPDELRQQLREVGFKEVEFLADSANIFPTVIAQK